MPRLRVFNLSIPEGARAWLDWRARVIDHELYTPNWHGSTMRWKHRMWEVIDYVSKRACHYHDKRPPGRGRRHFPPSFYAVFWADDNYWAILPTLTKSAKE